MAGKRKPLSPAQQIALNGVKDARRQYTQAKEETETRIRAAVKEENDAFELSYALAIRRARELDVPLSTIGVEGMGTSDPHTPKRWLKKTERLVMQVAVGDAPRGVFTWHDKASGAVTVRYEAFPTTVVADDYPVVLQGVAKLDITTQTGWVVESDPGTIDTDMGPLKGWFSVEIEDVSKSIPGSLTAQLDEWVEANR